ncbi:hypothetical protein [Streptomyces erythrochromogenes]|uniref:hypothetical protein n=1 Tax=Streptomyces erythrochromogenes TaxID=285574 RepID=UPI0036F82EB6
MGEGAGCRWRSYRLRGEPGWAGRAALDADVGAGKANVEGRTRLLWCSAGALLRSMAAAM